MKEFRFFDPEEGKWCKDCGRLVPENYLISYCSDCIYIRVTSNFQNELRGYRLTYFFIN